MQNFVFDPLRTFMAEPTLLSRKTTLTPVHWLTFGILTTIGLGASCLSGGDFLSANGPIGPEWGIRQEQDATLPDVDSIKNRITQIESNTDLDDDQKKAAIASYKQAIIHIGDIKTAEEALKGFESDYANFSSNLLKAKSRLKALSTAASNASPPSIDIAGLSLKEMEQKLSEASDKLMTAVTAVQKAEAEPGRRSTRIEAMKSENSTLQADIEKTAKAIKENAGDTPMSQAELLSLRAKKKLLEVKLQKNQAEEAAYKQTSEMLPVQADIAELERTVAKQLLDAWQNQVNRERKLEISRQAEEARKALQQATPPLAEIAREVSQLTMARNGLATRIETAAADLKKSRELLGETKSEFERSREKIEVIGLTDESGQILRRRRSALPDIRKIRSQLTERNSILAESRFEQYEYQDSRFELANLDEAVKSLLGDLQTEATPEITAETTSLLTKKREYLDGLTGDYETYIKTLLDLNDLQRQLLKASVEYKSFIDQRVLWIRSAFVFGQRDIKPGMDAAYWLFSFSSWKSILDTFQDLSWSGIVIRILLLMSVLSLFVFRPALTRQIRELGEQANRRGFHRFQPTFRVLLLTIVRTLPGPLLMALLSFHLAGGNSRFCVAISYGLFDISVCWLALEFVRKVFRIHGLAEAHLNWPSSLLRNTSNAAEILILIGLPLLAISQIMHYQTIEPLWSNSLGRAAFIGFCVTLSYFLMMVLFFPSGMLKILLPENSSSGRWFLRLVGSGLMVLPIVIATLAFFGYYETAQTLTSKFLQTCNMIFVLMLAQGILKRWILIRRRRIMLEQLRARSQQETPDESVPEADDLIDATSVSLQSGKLLRTLLIFFGLLFGWWIWVDVVPALKILGQDAVWPGITEITWSDFSFSIVVIILTWVAAANIPGFLELTVLNYLPIDSGARYAVTTLSRYVIIGIGVAVAGSTIGVSWTSIQWLVAAMGIGLGFGLQEIFANFISGIILLFERPIRVGDIITIGDTTGVVTRIRMRATTIIDWDRKEFIVPNKDLVTGRLLNWTLSDQINRIIIRVGVAYGSDTKLARDLLIKVANENEMVLNDPAPMATFEEFGDSTLNLLLRCYLPNLDNRLVCITEIHTSIDHEFKEAGIEIAFPQQDIHVRSFEDLVRIKEETVNPA